MSSIVKPPLGVLLNHGHPLSTGIVGCWMLNEGAGALGRVIDLSGNGNHGTLEGGVASVPGKFGTATRFNGAGVADSVNCGYANLVGGGSEMTIVLWIRPSITARDEAKFFGQQGNSAGNRVFRAYWHNTVDRIYFNVHNESQTQFAGYYEGPFGGAFEWKQVVCRVHSSGEVAVFVNTIKGSSTGSFTGLIDDGGSTAYDHLRIGSEAVNGVGDRAWEGDIDHFLIYNRSLSTQEIASLYRDPFQMFHREPIELWVGSVGAGAPPTVVPQIQYLRNMAAVA